MLCASRAEPSCPTIICLHLNMNVPLPMKSSKNGKRYQQIKHMKKCQETHHFMFCRHSWCLFVLCTYFRKFCGNGDNAWRSIKRFYIVISFSFVPSYKCNINSEKKTKKRKQDKNNTILFKIPWKISESVPIPMFWACLRFRLNSKH